jgi:putative flippase GtrA
MTGDSKMTTEKKKEIRRAILFTLFSASAGIIQTLSFTLMNELFRWTYWVSYLVALILSVIWNFTLNRNITFRSAANVPLAMMKVAAFYVVFTPLSTWGGQLLESAGWNEYLVLALSMLANFVLEYLYDRFVVFGKSIDTRKKEQI